MGELPRNLLLSTECKAKTGQPKPLRIVHRAIVVEASTQHSAADLELKIVAFVARWATLQECVIPKIKERNSSQYSQSKKQPLQKSTPCIQ